MEQRKSFETKTNKYGVIFTTKGGRGRVGGGGGGNKKVLQAQSCGMLRAFLNTCPGKSFIFSSLLWF